MKKCDNCGSEKLKKYHRLSYMDIEKCKNCGLVFSTNKKEKDEDLYQEDYFKESHKEFFEDFWEGYETKSSERLDRFRRTLRILEKYAKKGKMLDVGCATGVFPDMAKKNGWEAYGVDLSEFASDYARKTFGIKVKTGTLNNAKFKKDFFDLVTMWDFIEHVGSVSEIIKEANRILKKDGILYILTINDDSFMGHMSNVFYKLGIKKFSELIHPIHHNYHFTKNVLIDILKRNGFEIVKVKKSDMPTDSCTCGAPVKAAYMLTNFISKTLNWGHEVRIIARKKGDRNE